MNYEVTIGIPVYNVRKYIHQAMDSALAQTFQSIEFLVLDDCGTDGSMDIVREYQQTHPRGKHIRIVSQPQNMGIGAGRNRMMDEARGRYFYFMDADDEIVLNAIEKLYSVARDIDADLVYGSYERVESFGKETKVQACQYEDRRFLEENSFAEYVYRQYDGVQAPVWNILLKTSFLHENNIRFSHVNYWEDFAVTINLPVYVKRAAMLSAVTYRYYCRFGTLSNFQKRSHIDKAEIETVVAVMERLKQDCDTARKKPYFSQWFYKIMMTHYYMACAVLRQKAAVHPAFTDRELRNMMRSPLSLTQTLALKPWRMRHLFLYLLGILPPKISVGIIQMVGKQKSLIS